MKISFDIDKVIALDGEREMDYDEFLGWLRDGLGGEVFKGLADIIEDQLPTYPKDAMAIYDRLTDGGKLSEKDQALLILLKEMGDLAGEGNIHAQRCIEAMKLDTKHLD